MRGSGIPRRHPGEIYKLADAKPKRRPPTGKKKTKGRDSGEWFTTFPQRSGKKSRDKQKTLSHYNDLLRNFSIKRKLVSLYLVFGFVFIFQNAVLDKL